MKESCTGHLKMAAEPFVYVALDHNDRSKNLSLARDLSSFVESDRFGFKVNLDSVANFSPEGTNAHRLISEVMGSNDKPVFVDLKMWNGGRTMENMAKGCADLGVSLINMYPHAGKKFMERIVKALEGYDTKLFGLTVLTHYTDEDTMRLYGKNFGDSVRMFVEMNHEYGADGSVLPATQLDAVSDIDTLKLCPAIRPTWYADKKANDQEQISTPQGAVEGGADYLVMGSPIIKADNPAVALKRVLSEI